ncbi:hypothetical protein ACFZBU_39855 [Embleya sp. NPDC008237]|uniref:hypothetical protein n=1 Tax=Embleya sp. NPDC008237 TaxID=3363978 RepID=UPI0036E89851
MTQLDQTTPDSMREDLLRQVITTDVHLRRLSPGTGEWDALIALSGAAYTALAFLDALAAADPAAAAEATALIAGRIEGADQVEFAWDAASAAGYDPQVWVDAITESLARKDAR